MAGDIRSRFKHWGTWLVTIALEIGATLMAVRAAWLMVATLFVGGLITLALGYWPEVRTFLIRRLASNSPGLPGHLEYLETDESGQLRQHMSHDVRRKFAYIVAAAVVALSTIVGAGFYFEHRAKPQQHHSDKPVASRLDNTMQLTCADVPRNSIPRDVQFVELTAKVVGGKDSIGVGVSTESDQGLKDSPQPLLCQLHNFKQEAAINVVITMQVALRKFRTIDLGLASRKGVPVGQMQELGAVIQRGLVPLPYQNIGPSSSFFFFVRNFVTDAVLQVSLLNYVMGEAVGEPKWGRIKLISVPETSFALSAWKPRNKVFIYSDALYPIPKGKPSSGSPAPTGKWTVLPSTPAPPPSQAVVERDPDTIYQLGDPVAKVEGVHPHLDQGAIEFEVIRDNGTFNIMAECEYRDYVLRVGQMGRRSGGSTFGQPFEILTGYVFQIVRKRT